MLNRYMELGRINSEINAALSWVGLITLFVAPFPFKYFLSRQDRNFDCDPEFRDNTYIIKIKGELPKNAMQEISYVCSEMSMKIIESNTVQDGDLSRIIVKAEHNACAIPCMDVEIKISEHLGSVYHFVEVEMAKQKM